MAFLTRGSIGVPAPAYGKKLGGDRMNQKVGLSYFPVECVTEEDIKLVTAEFGLQAFAIIIKLFQKIYGEFGYYCVWNREVGLLFAQENGMSCPQKEGAGCSQVSLLNEIVLCCTRRGVFSRLQYEGNGILTSKKIQENYLLATKRRKNVVLRKAYLLLNVAHLPENVSILDENVVAPLVGAWIEIVYFHPDNYGWIEDSGEMEKRNLCVEKGKKEYNSNGLSI